jgi:hypothetical protein
VNGYDEKPLTGVIGTGQMDGVCAVPPAAGETRIHVGDTESIDVRRPPGKNIGYELKENPIETSRIVMLGSGRWTG